TARGANGCPVRGGIRCRAKGRTGMVSITKLSALAALIGGLFWVSTAHATSAVVKCQEAKLKAHGKYELCLKKSAAKVAGGKPDASAACETKFQDALTKADTKAGTPCKYLDNGDGTVSALDTGLVWEKKDSTCPGEHCYTDTFTWTA